MRIVVSGTHASGKSTLISDLAARDRALEVLHDPYEDIDGELHETGAGAFVAQLEVTVERLLGLERGRSVIAERGPIDMLAYLAALSELGRSGGAAATVRRLAGHAAAAMRHVDLVLLVPLDPAHAIWVDQEEDPDLRDAVDVLLGELLEDPDLVGDVPVVEVVGDRAARAAQAAAAIAAARSAAR